MVASNGTAVPSEALLQSLTSLSGNEIPDVVVNLEPVATTGTNPSASGTAFDGGKDLLIDIGGTPFSIDDGKPFAVAARDAYINSLPKPSRQVEKQALVINAR